jgi:CrcB protein
VSPAILTLCVMVGGGIGAVLRGELDRFITRKTDVYGPLGIFVINTLASALIGLLTGVGLGTTGADPLAAQIGTVVSTGFLGGFSTLSTVATDSAKLLQSRQWVWLVTNTLGMLIVSAGLCLAGFGFIQLFV